jgi:transposase
MPRIRHPYPSDLTDQEWALLGPLLSSAEKRGRPPKWPARRVADAVFYLLRSGCPWRMLPREYPPWQTVYYHFWKWRRDGRLRRAHDRLREAVREAVRESEGRKANPSAAVIDSQAVKGTPGSAALSAATTERSGFLEGNVTCSWTQAGSCSAHASTQRASCTTATAHKSS